MNELWKLFAAFFRIGLFTFGGGYSMLPMLEHEVVERHNWVTQEEMLDYFALGQCMPGIIAANVAIFIGHKRRGTLGAIFSTLGVVLPSLIIITLIAAVLENFSHIPAVQHAFAGIRAAVAALIAAAVVRLFKNNVLQKKRDSEGEGKAFALRSLVPLLLCAAAFVLVGFADVSPIYVVIGAALAGLLLMKRGEA